MRVIGYVREAPGPESGDTVFVQSERIRRWVAQNACQMLALCQDPRVPDDAGRREGFRALLGILSTGQVDAIVVPSVEALSGDKITQEVMLWDLGRRGVNVISTEEADHATLADPTSDPARLLIRDVLGRAQDHRSSFGRGAPAMPTRDLDRDVLIELIPDQPGVARAS